VIDPSAPASDRPRTLGRLSVIVVTHDSVEVIGRALDEVFAALPRAELVVVDNGSSDGTLELLGGHPGVRLVTGHGNVGFGGGVNRGARAASGDLLLVINPDVSEITVDQAALQALEASPRLGMLACEVRETGRIRRPVYVRWGWRMELCWALAEWYLTPRAIELRRPRPRGFSSRWISGAAFLVRRSELIEVGGFDERLFLYYEDFELSRSYAAHGLPLASTRAVILEHRGQSSSPRDEDWLSSRALLSLIEQTAKWEGVAASRRAARWAWRLLAAIEIVGDGVGAVPWLGSRGRHKAASAAHVRAHLRRAAAEPAEPHYPQARAALQAVLRG
jgi:N-acetylglucosaminyl-diphospho-decaprenol L-rhamnosyltransferase